MSDVWNRVYTQDNVFFGEKPSNFAKLCFNIMEKNEVKKILELGAGHGRDSIYFASKGINVYALDYSKVGIEILNKHAKQNNLEINAKIFDLKKSFPYSESSFDAVYSHMLFNMNFSQEELRFILSEIKRVLRPRGLNFFSVRNDHDKFYMKGIKINDKIYEINGFEIQFFTEQEIKELLNDFEVLSIKEEQEESVTLYFVFSKLRN